MDDERSFVKPKAVLRKGQSFGELAIIHGDRRRSTIVAMEETELLSLWHEVRAISISISTLLKLKNSQIFQQ